MIASNPYEANGGRARSALRCRASACGRRPRDRRDPAARRGRNRRGQGPTCSRAIGGCRRRRRANSAPTVLHHRRPRHDRRRRLSRHRRPRQGPDHLRGFNVYPKEIESEIDAIAGVVESAVIGVPHRDLGEGVTGDRRGARRRAARRGGDPVGARRPAGEIQTAQARAVRRRPAAQRHGQGAEGGAEGALQGDL